MSISSHLFSLSPAHSYKPSSLQPIYITRTYYNVCLILIIIFLLYTLLFVVVNLIKKFKNCQFAQYAENCQFKTSKQKNQQQQSSDSQQQHIILNQFLIVPQYNDIESQKQNFLDQKVKDQFSNQIVKKSHKDDDNKYAKIIEIQNNFMYMGPFLILSIVSVSIFNSNIVIGICAIIYVILYVFFNVARIGNKFTILKMAYVVPVIVGGVMLYMNKENGIVNMI